MQHIQTMVEPDLEDDEKEFKGGKKKAKEDKKATKDGKKKPKDDEKTTKDGEKEAKDIKKPANDGEGAPAEIVPFSDEKVDAIVKALASGNLVRPDECLFALAFLVRTYSETEARKNIYNKVPEVITTSKDLFQFVYFCQALNKEYNNSEKLSFGNAMKRAIREWYGKQDNLEDLLAMDRSWYTWCHKDLIKKAHVKLEDESKMQVLDVVCGGVGEQWATKQAILEDDPEADEGPADAASPAVAQSNEELREAARAAKERADSEQQAAKEAAKAYAEAVKAAEVNEVKVKAKIHVEKARTAAVYAEAARKAAEKVAVAYGVKKVKKPYKKSTEMEVDPAASIAMEDASAEPINPEDKEEVAAAMVAAGRAAATRIAEAQIAEAQVAAAQTVGGTSDALQTFRRIKKFKRTQNVNEAAKAIGMYKYPLQVVPSQLHSVKAIWASLLPHMPYREIVQAVLHLQDHKLLEDKSSTIYERYSTALNSFANVAESKISPIFIYQVMRLYEEKQRHLNTVKEAMHATKVLSQEGGVVVDTDMLERFRTVLNTSLKSHQTSDHRKYMVTLDLRSQYNKKRIFGNRLMSCMAAQALLILPILKRAPRTQIFKFTTDMESLSKVDIPREADFFDAFEKLKESPSNDSAKDFKKISQKESTKVDIKLPLELAKKFPEENVDVFITIVDSLIRVNPKRDSPDGLLKEYNKTKDAKARYIIINLCRHTQDVNVNVTSKGVLEVAGCPEEIFKVIDAYVGEEFA